MRAGVGTEKVLTVSPAYTKGSQALGLWALYVGLVMERRPQMAGSGGFDQLDEDGLD
jgi:hypothetical protein